MADVFCSATCARADVRMDNVVHVSHVCAVLSALFLMVKYMDTVCCYVEIRELKLTGLVLC